VQTTDVSVTFGPAWNWGRLRLGPSVEARYTRSAVRYGDDERRTVGLWGGGALGQAILRLVQAWPLYVSAQVGVALQQTESAASESKPSWAAVPFAGLGLAARLY
jgi:hypothetical protein